MSSGRILYRRILKVSTALSVSSTAGSSATTPPSDGTLDSSHSDSSLSSAAPQWVEIKGIIFDMDGTLTLPVLNFKEMRAHLGLCPNQDILPTVLSFPPDRRARAMAIIEELEEEGIQCMQLQPGVLDLLHYIAERGVKRALMTRNSTKAATSFLQRLNDQLAGSLNKYPHLQQDKIFSEVVTRDFQPCKPDPAAALNICRQWQLEPHEVAIVGDDKTDMICGIRAGSAFNILLRNDRNREQVDYSSFQVESLSDIISIFSVPLEVLPKQEDQNIS